MITLYPRTIQKGRIVIIGNKTLQVIKNYNEKNFVVKNFLFFKMDPVEKIKS